MNLPAGVECPTTVAGCREVLSKHARSFRWAGSFLPADRLDDAAVVYALCRLIDDIADERESDEDALRELAALERELREEDAPRPLVALFLETAKRTQIPVAAALELIVGVRTDMHPVRVSDDASLLRYCYRVAGTVGLMMCGVLGVRDAEALPYAIDLGVGMQLTNICRDVAEDAGRERVYLPATRLAEAGVEPGSLLARGASRAPSAPVVRDLLLLAERYYGSADAGMRYIPWRARFAILVASRVYRAIGFRVRAQGFDPDRGRAYLGTGRKLWWTLRALAHGLRLAVQRPRAHRAALHAPLAGLPGTNTRALPPGDAPDAGVAVAAA